MIPRYEHPAITSIWTDSAKLARWDQVELAAIKARVRLGRVDMNDFEIIEGALTANPVEARVWKERERAIGHDLAAYVELRQEQLPKTLRYLFHQGLTSYDTEDPAFAVALLQSSGVAITSLEGLRATLLRLALKYRYTPMLERTHGQWARPASFGSRVLSWLAQLQEANEALHIARDACMRSKLSGAIGTYSGGLSPEIEAKVLSTLGLKPFLGATQIVPRIVFARLAQALELVAVAISNIAVDVELGARSGYTLWQEPFGTQQKGSSAMPHKKNTIATEQMEGMARLAAGYTSAIVESAKSKERRDIAQSCVERVAWPDLFHVVLRMLTTMTRVLGGMVVYPDAMLRELVDSRGTYAAEEAKVFLAEELAKEGVVAEVAYRIVQYAAWNALSPKGAWVKLRDEIAENLDEAEDALEEARFAGANETLTTIEGIIGQGELVWTDELAATSTTVLAWNQILKRLFARTGVGNRWEKIFRMDFLLAGERTLFEHFIGD